MNSDVLKYATGRAKHIRRVSNVSICWHGKYPGKMWRRMSILGVAHAPTNSTPTPGNARVGRLKRRHVVLLPEWTATSTGQYLLITLLGDTLLRCSKTKVILFRNAYKLRMCLGHLVRRGVDSFKVLIITYHIYAAEGRWNTRKNELYRTYPILRSYTRERDETMRWNINGERLVAPRR